LKIRIKDIAGKANVSVGTVDRVIHNRGEVSAATREKVLSIINELGYKPDILARTLASNKTYNIAVCMPLHNSENVFWELPQAGLEKAYDELYHFGIKINKYLFDQFDKNSFIKQKKSLLESDPDAVLLAPKFYKESVSFIDKCSELKIPVVLIDSNIRHKNIISFIGQNSFQSGYLAGKLINYSIKEKSTILVLNLAKEIDSFFHISKRQEGFCTYLSDFGSKNNKILKIDIGYSENKRIPEIFSELFEKNKDIGGIFVTNSQVYRVADYLNKSGNKNKILIGYDLIKENISYLENSIIDFLISQKPEEQAYRGIMSIFNHLVLNKPVKDIQFLPIDIITSENLQYYLGNN